MEFEYLKDYKETINIENILNCYITCVNDDGLEWYLCTTTENEKTTVKTFGPLKVDVNLLTEDFSYFYQEYENTDEVASAIKDFIMDNNKNITEVMELTEEQYLQRWEEISNKL